MNFGFFGNSEWSINNVTPPWGNRPSIYWHLVNHLAQDATGLVEDGETLPDEETLNSDSQIRWAAGALDGVFGHHVGTDEESSKVAQKILQAIRDFTHKANDKNASKLYSLLLENNALNFADTLLEEIVNAEKLDLERLQTIARWLAMEAADREVVKIAIAVLGLFRGDENRDILMTLGRHEEFTLYSVVALQNTQEDPEQALWQVAQHVRGWGRIHIIERLTETRDEYIKDWLLREGYQNEIMYEYTALVCAQTGELHLAIAKTVVDDELLKGAGDILTTLLNGSGPAEGIESYQEGALASELYLEHIIRHENNLEEFVNADKFEQFLADENEYGYRSLPENIVGDWKERRANMLKLIKAIKSKQDWESKAQQGLDETDRLKFWTATEAAKIIGIDVWENYFAKIKSGEDYWWNVMQTDDPQRVQKVIDFAEETIPLDEIATGASDELGLGEEFKEHQKLDWILQDLRRFPGKGIKLIHTGLQSPVVRNRNMAVNALANWKKEDWSEETTALLKEALKVEPNEQTRELIEKVISGEPIY